MTADATSLPPSHSASYGLRPGLGLRLGLDFCNLCHGDLLLNPLILVELCNLLVKVLGPIDGNVLPDPRVDRRMELLALLLDHKRDLIVDDSF